MFLLPVHTMFPELNVSAVVLGFCMRIVMAANLGGLKSQYTSFCAMSLRLRFVRPNEKVATQFCTSMLGRSSSDGFSCEISYLLFPIVLLLISCDTP